MLKRDGKLDTVSTPGGRVLVSRFRGDPTVYVKSQEELEKVASRGSFVEIGAERVDKSAAPINNRLLGIAGLPPQLIPAQSQSTSSTRPSVVRNAQPVSVTQGRDTRKRTDNLRAEAAPFTPAQNSRTRSKEPNTSTPEGSQNIGYRPNTDFSFETY